MPLIPIVPLPSHSLPSQIFVFPSVPVCLQIFIPFSFSLSHTPNTLFLIMASSNGTTSGTGSPCGACKFLRRKCAPDCIFAPYFCSEQGPARFAAIHKVFGASNVSKLLLHIPAHERCEAVVTIAYEAQARIRDPVYGCVSHIFALQQQVHISFI
ncbi:LOB domain-containing protein 16, variant 2 [Lathyrus oleraceus]|uniref:LOB domain-containing protein 16, variant 2 n=1 Tax=Pisum sativum TaxID=3888 RepID=A0A9D4XXL4_PEA|nr:LOB domain-containing protein 16, variant 2 [Pisum sativum]